MSFLTQKKKAVAILGIAVGLSFWAGCSDGGSGNGESSGNTPMPPTKYEVSYSAGEGSGTPPATQELESGRRIFLPGQGNMTAPSQRVFDGWRDGAGRTYQRDEGYTVTENVRFIAQWRTVSTPNPEPDPQPNLPPAPDIWAVEITWLSEGNVHIGWFPVSGAVSYNLYRATSASATPVRLNVEIKSMLGDNGLFYYYDDNVSPGTYFYSVSSVNSNGESPRSEVVSITVSGGNNNPQDPEPNEPEPEIDVPQGVWAGSFNESWLKGVEISWFPVEGANHYNVYRSRSTNFGSTPIGTSNTFASNPNPEGQKYLYYHDANLADGAYFYRVSAVNAQGEGDFSQTVAVVVNNNSNSGGGGSGSGGQTQNVEIINIALTPNERGLTITWSGNAEAYNIYRASSKNAPISSWTLFERNHRGNSIDDSPLTFSVGNGFFYRIAPVANGVEGQWSVAKGTTVPMVSVRLLNPASYTSTVRFDINGMEYAVAPGASNRSNSMTISLAPGYYPFRTKRGTLAWVNRGTAEFKAFKSYSIDGVSGVVTIRNTIVPQE